MSKLISKTGIALIAVIVALVLAPAALAQQSSVETYGGQGNEVANVTEGADPGNGEGNPAGTASAGSGGEGTLPFTGLDIGLLAAGGALLFGVGLVLARTVPNRPQA